MAAPTYVSNGGSSTGTTSVTPSLPPSLNNGDLLITVINSIATTAETSCSTPSGWTPLSQNVGTTTATYIFYRVRQAGDAAPTYTLTGTNINGTVGVCSRFTGASTTTPIGVIGSWSTGTSTPITSSGIVSTNANSLAVLVFGNDYTGSGAITPATPASWTYEWNLHTNGPIAGAILYIQALTATGSSSGVTSSAINNTSHWASLQFEIKSLTNTYTFTGDPEAYLEGATADLHYTASVTAEGDAASLTLSGAASLTLRRGAARQLTLAGAVRTYTNTGATATPKARRKFAGSPETLTLTGVEGTPLINGHAFFTLDGETADYSSDTGTASWNTRRRIVGSPNTLALTGSAGTLATGKVVGWSPVNYPVPYRTPRVRIPPGAFPQIPLHHTWCDAEWEIAYAPSVTLDLSAAANFGPIYLFGDTLFTDVVNPNVGQTGHVRLAQDWVGGRLLSFTSSWFSIVTDTLLTTPLAQTDLYFQVTNLDPLVTNYWFLQPVTRELPKYIP